MYFISSYNEANRTHSNTEYLVRCFIRFSGTMTKEESPFRLRFAKMCFFFCYSLLDNFLFFLG